MKGCTSHPGVQRWKRHCFLTVPLCLALVPQPPIVPKLCGEGDTSNFEAYPENDWNTAPPVSPKDLEVFKNF